MFVWEKSSETTLNGITVKMYRDRYVPEKTQKIPFEGNDLDHIAYKYLGSEVYTYKVMDTNFIALMEERFDLQRVTNIYVPVKESTI